jgi:hypothetical protein
MFSASKLASFKIDAASLEFFYKIRNIAFFYDFSDSKPATIPIIPEITIVIMSMFVKIYIKAYIKLSE